MTGHRAVLMIERVMRGVEVLQDPEWDNAGRHERGQDRSTGGRA